MCDPATALVASSFLIQGTGMVMGARAEAAQSRAQRQAADAAARAALTDIAAREGEEKAAAAQSIFQIERQVRTAGSLARTAAGAAGVGGISVDALMTDLDQQGETAKLTTKRNLESTLDQLKRERRGVAAGAQSRINQAPMPNPWLSGLQIAGTGLDLASQVVPRPARRSR